MDNTASKFAEGSPFQREQEQRCAPTNLPGDAGELDLGRPPSLALPSLEAPSTINPRPSSSRPLQTQEADRQSPAAPQHDGDEMQEGQLDQQGPGPSAAAAGAPLGSLPTESPRSGLADPKRSNQLFNSLRSVAVATPQYKTAALELQSTLAGLQSRLANEMGDVSWSELETLQHQFHNMMETHPVFSSPAFQAIEKALQGSGLGSLPTVEQPPLKKQNRRDGQEEPDGGDIAAAVAALRGLEQHNHQQQQEGYGSGNMPPPAHGTRQQDGLAAGGGQQEQYGHGLQANVKNSEQQQWPSDAPWHGNGPPQPQTIMSTPVPGQTAGIQYNNSVAPYQSRHPQSGYGQWPQNFAAPPQPVSHMYHQQQQQAAMDSTPNGQYYQGPGQWAQEHEHQQAYYNQYGGQQYPGGNNDGYAMQQQQQYPGGSAPQQNQQDSAHELLQLLSTLENNPNPALRNAAAELVHLSLAAYQHRQQQQAPRPNTSPGALEDQTAAVALLAMGNSPAQGLPSPSAATTTGGRKRAGEYSHPMTHHHPPPQQPQQQLPYPPAPYAGHGQYPQHAQQQPQHGGGFMPPPPPEAAAGDAGQMHALMQAIMGAQYQQQQQQGR